VELFDFLDTVCEASLTKNYITKIER